MKTIRPQTFGLLQLISGDFYSQQLIPDIKSWN